MLLNRVPAILRKEIYATAALLGASILVVDEALGWSRNWLTWLAIAVCFALRLLSLRYGWHLRLSVVEVRGRANRRPCGPEELRRTVAR